MRKLVRVGNMVEKLRFLGACEPGWSFVSHCRTVKAAWDKCKLPSHMLWALRKLGAKAVKNPLLGFLADTFDHYIPRRKRASKLFKKYQALALDLLKAIKTAKRNGRAPNIKSIQARLSLLDNERAERPWDDRLGGLHYLVKDALGCARAYRVSTDEFLSELGRMGIGKKTADLIRKNLPNPACLYERTK